MTEDELMDARLIAIDQKVDAMLALMHAADTRLSVHLAMDEAQWEKVARSETLIANLAADSGRVKTKLAVIVATIAGAGASLPGVLRMFL